MFCFNLCPTLAIQIFFLSGEDFKCLDPLSYVEYLDNPIPIPKIDGLDGDLLQLLDSPVLIAIHDEGGYNLLTRGGVNQKIICSNFDCRFHMKACSHCLGYQGAYYSYFSKI